MLQRSTILQNLLPLYTLAFFLLAAPFSVAASAPSTAPAPTTTQAAIPKPAATAANPVPPKPPFPLADAATQSESAAVTLRGIENPAQERS